MEILTYGIGLKFTNTSSNLQHRKFDLLAYINNKANTQPVVIFPEVSKNIKKLISYV